MKQLSELDIKHTNQRLLVEELLRRDIDVANIDSTIELISATYWWRVEFILDRSSSIVADVHMSMTANKHLSKKIMSQAGITVPAWELFDIYSISWALNYTQENLTYPIVLKPNYWSHWENIQMNINSEDELKIAIATFLQDNWTHTRFILEEQFAGEEYRIFITREWKYAAIHRDCAFVIWDWVHNIVELVELENKERQSNYTTKSLCPIIIDTSLIQDTNKIPDNWEKLFVRSNSNVASWGFSVDATDIIHPSVITLAQKALSSFWGLPYAGIDFMTTDVTREQTTDSYRIIEINSNPGFSMHMYPWTGTPRNIAEFVVDMIFPESKFNK